jgi:16S rRNA (cytosine1402-N4)-methyltransferase
MRRRASRRIVPAFPLVVTRSTAVHVPVLLREVLANLDLRPGLVVVDGTVGAGGHSREIITRIRPGGCLIGLDRDPLMLGFARQAVSGDDVHLIHSSYRELRTVLDGLPLPAADRVLLDLGLSSDQLDDRARGFGFDAGGTLDMRFDVSQGRSAADWLARATEDELTHAFATWGEIPQAGKLAAAIVQRRRTHPIGTAEVLTDLVQMTLGRGPSANPRAAAAPVFQAIRIAVNDELAHLQSFFTDGLPGCLATTGRVAIITFHSVEDRLVKQALRPEHGWTPLAKKPIEPTPAEVRVNPRSRSAKLRVAVRSTQPAARN